jgi:hypothetical protein
MCARLNDIGQMKWWSTVSLEDRIRMELNLPPANILSTDMIHRTKKWD